MRESTSRRPRAPCTTAATRRCGIHALGRGHAWLPTLLAVAAGAVLAGLDASAVAATPEGSAAAESAEESQADRPDPFAWYTEVLEGIANEVVSDAFDQVEPRARIGDHNAQFLLGKLYEIGLGVPQDDELAVEWYRRAIEGDVPAAYNSLGVLVALGRGTPADAVRSFELYETAARLGLAEGQFNLGYRYEVGKGTEQSYELAVHWYEKAARGGHLKARFNLGNFYWYGRGVKQSASKARTHWEIAAEAGDAASMGQLAAYYESPVARNMEQAFLWQKRAAEAGDVEGMSKLGNRYLEGRGVERNPVEAVRWWTRAEAAGDVGAQVNLGLAYLRGFGVAHDPERGALLVRSAIARGSPTGRYPLGMHLLESGERAEGLRMLKRAAAGSNPEGQNAAWALALIYARGDFGVARDAKEASSWAFRADDLGHPQARDLLRNLQVGPLR